MANVLIDNTVPGSVDVVNILLLLVGQDEMSSVVSFGYFSTSYILF